MPNAIKIRNAAGRPSSIFMGGWVDSIDTAVCPLLYESHLDRIAFAIGGAVVMTAYPAWFLLSLGDWVGSPHALGLWVMTVTVMLGVFAMLKVRNLVV